MKSIDKYLSTNNRLIKEHLTKYKNTFQAFCELINNSIQAKANRIDLFIDYQNSSVSKAPIKSITIRDNGKGVPFNEVEKRLLEVGTTVKEGGQGIGRFGALQIGEVMTIETVGYDESEKKYSKTIITIDSSTLNNTHLEKTQIKVDYEYLDSEINTYYQISINRLHHQAQNKIPKRQQICGEFLIENIEYSIFEQYLYEIFEQTVTFYINNKKIDKQDFIIGKPSLKTVEYLNLNDKAYDLFFQFYNIKSSINKVKVFFCIENVGLKTVAHEFTYTSPWYTDDLGTWFIYVDSTLFSSDLFRNLDIETLGHDEIKNIKAVVRETISNFFKSKNKHFDNFINTLENDKYYPYKEYKPVSTSQEFLFKKSAYILENEHKLIKNNNEARSLIYPLLDRVISDGNIEYIFNKFMDLSQESLEKFRSLLNQTDLEDVVLFTTQVAEKLEFLSLLDGIVYGSIAKHLKERKQLHKIVENQLWLFGESYIGTPNLWSDRRLDGILRELREKHFNYQPTKEDENLIEIDEEGLEDITDLFFFNEKITDNEEREIMVVELKAPNCAIGTKELNQIDRYAYTIESNSQFPSENIKYKLILISSRLTGQARSTMKSRKAMIKSNKPFLYEVKTEKNIEIYVIEWSELIESNKRKLGYLSSKLKIKDIDVKQKFEKEYPQLIDEKFSAQLRLIK